MRFITAEAGTILFPHMPLTSNYECLAFLQRFFVLFYIKHFNKKKL